MKYNCHTLLFSFPTNLVNYAVINREARYKIKIINCLHTYLYLCIVYKYLLESYNTRIVISHIKLGDV